MDREDLLQHELNTISYGITSSTSDKSYRSGFRVFPNLGRRYFASPTSTTEKYFPYVELDRVSLETTSEPAKFWRLRSLAGGG